MRDRLRRQVRERTDMLSGVSHDLRTPLTRMKLELAMAADSEAARELSAEVNVMEHMLDGYLAFARGECGEKPEPTDLASCFRTWWIERDAKNVHRFTSGGQSGLPPGHGPSAVA